MGKEKTQTNHTMYFPVETENVELGLQHLQD